MPISREMMEQNGWDTDDLVNAFNNLEKINEELNDKLFNLQEDLDSWKAHKSKDPDEEMKRKISSFVVDVEDLLQDVKQSLLDFKPVE